MQKLECNKFFLQYRLLSGKSFHARNAMKIYGNNGSNKNAKAHPTKI